MSEQNPMKQTIENLLINLCNEALVEDTDSNQSVIFYTRAPKGKTIAEESTTISLNSRAYTLLQEVVTQLRQDKKLRLEFSKKELEQEAITSLFEGVKAVQDGALDAQALTDSLVTRLAESRETWEIYLPIEGLDLPDKEQLYLAGGVFKALMNDEKDLLRNQCVKIWDQAKWQSSQHAESGIRTLSQYLDEALTSSKMWYQIQVNGRQEAAKNRAVEAAVLSMDILAFFALLNGIDPEAFACHFPHQAKRGIMKSIQIVSGKACSLPNESGFPFPYTLDSSKYGKLINLKEFQQIQAMSNSEDPNPVQQRFLLGVQQYAEATRLPSLSARLVWYLSGLETLLLKETEHKSRVTVKRRLGKFLNSNAAQRLDSLYDKRVKSVHYGHRNQIGEEFITETDVHDAKSLSYLGIILALKYSNNLASIDAFLDYINSLPDIVSNH